MVTLEFQRVALKVLTSFVEYGFLHLDLGLPLGHPRAFRIPYYQLIVSRRLGD